MSRTLRVLIVDDDDDDRFLLQDLLTEVDGYTFDIETANSYEEAHERFLENRHDIYFLDYRLGKKTGLHLIQELSPQGAVIMLTGQDTEGADVLALQAGAVDYLAKGELSKEALERSIRYSVERKRYQTLLEESQQRLSIALTASGIGTWDVDLATETADWDEQMLELFDLPEGHGPQTMSDAINLVIPEDQSKLAAAVEEALHEGAPFEVDFAVLLNDGSLRYLATRGDLVRDHTGKAVRLSGACWDVSEKRKAQDQQQLLLAELDHRVKNTLQVVLSIAQRTIRSSTSMKEFDEAFTGRIMALAETHSLLTSQKWRGVPVQEMVRIIVRSHGDNERIVVGSSPHVVLTPEASQLLYLAMHELVTNATKYGALSTTEGKVFIEWRTLREGERRKLEFSWREEGGPLVTEPSSKGFGSFLIKQSIEYELDGTVRHEYHRDGVSCDITFLLAEKVQTCVEEE